jgi:TRAP-type C4-dicarboxylate transport system permease small subunit
MNGQMKWLVRALFVVGSVGLLGAMFVDAGAVLGRHIGTPLLGSIEIAEACIVLMASASLVTTTLERGHASVHIVTQRLGSGPRAWFQRFADALSALFFAAIVIGSGIVAADLWHGDEQSELLGIPIAPLRVFWGASAAGVAIAFFAHALARRRSSP